MSVRKLADADVKGKRVLVRVDFNVPLEAGSKVTDDTRIQGALPTIKYLLASGAKVVLCSHLGRPKGTVIERFRLAPVAERLSQLLGLPVTMAPDCVGSEVEHLVEQMSPGDVLLLENLRFHPEEEKNEQSFALKLSALCDVFVNDAFGAAHRAHASVVGVAQLVPSYAGFLLAREVAVLEEVLSAPERPFVAILGGAKISDKIGVIENLVQRVDTLILGGGMANTFLLARGMCVGASLAEADLVDKARELMAAAASSGVALELPVDVVVARDVSAQSAVRIVDVAEVLPNWKIVDVGPVTRKQYGRIVAGAGTVLWNGPLGVFEIKQFAAGTMAMAQAVAECTAKTVVGGGDSAAAVNVAGVQDKIDHISTGGGASLEFLEGKELPGLRVLR